MSSSSTRIPRDELRALHRRYKETTDAAERDRIRAQLVDAYHDFVYFLARKFQNRGEPLDDIVQVGYLGLIKAIERFDPDLGYEFTTFATLTVAGEIKRYFRDKGTAIRFPRRLQELHQSVVRVNEQMKNELGREPMVGELADRLGVSPDDVTDAMEMGPAYVPVSLRSRAASGSVRCTSRACSVPPWNSCASTCRKKARPSCPSSSRRRRATPSPSSTGGFEKPRRPARCSRTR